MPIAESAGASLYYEVQGEGPAIVLAHGRGGNSASWWQQVPVFAAQHRVIIFDHRTFGRSTGGGDAFTQRQLGDDIVALLDADGIAQAALVCQSMGGWSGLGAAVWHPDRVSCLVLTSTTAGLFPKSARAQLDTLREGRLGGPSLPFRALAEGYPAREPGLAWLYAQISGLNVNFDGRNMLALLQPENGLDPALLKGFSVPTLVIAAMEDAIFPPSTIKAVAEMIPGAELVNFPGAGHSPYWEQPDRYNELVAGFLGRHLTGGMPS